MKKTELIARNVTTLGPCPGCGNTLRVSDAEMDGEDAGPGLLHEMPFCSYFGRSDVEQIVLDMKLAIAKKAPN